MEDEIELTKKESDLIVILKHVNDNWPIVESAVEKLLKIHDFDYETVSGMTSLNIATLNNFAVRIETKEEEREPEKPIRKYRRYVRASTFPTNKTYGLVAFKLYNLVKSEYKKGDKFLTCRQVGERYQITKETARRSLTFLCSRGVLLAHGKMGYTVNI